MSDCYEYKKQNKRYIFVDKNYKIQKNELEVEVDLEFIVVKNEGRYQLLATLPFSFKSSWIQTEQENWEKYALERLTSKLNEKYKRIQIKDKRQRYFFKKFKEMTSINNDKKAFDKYSTIFNHGPLNERIGNHTIKAISDELDNIKKEDYIVTENNDDFLSWNKFIKLQLNGQCAYCNIKIEQINQLSIENRLYTKRARGYSMEIDQKDPYKFYTDDNCIEACYWCNNAKTDEFSPEEFKKISSGIKKVWEKRLTL